MSPHLLYIADPMCSWCWGFSPVIDAVRDHFEDRLPLRLLLGGLRPGTTEPMSEAMKSEIRGHWEHVEEATGQPFNPAFFDRDRFVYDTEPPSRAVVAVRRLQPDLAVDYLKELQKAFYALNLDVTDQEVLAGMAAEFGVDREIFTAEISSDPTIEETWRDFETARRLGVTGFPTLLAGSERRGYTLISAGYRPWEEVKERIDELVIGNL